MNEDVGTEGAELVGQAVSSPFGCLWELLKPMPPHRGNSLGTGGKSEWSPTLIKSAIPWARWVSVWQWKSQKPARRKTERRKYDVRGRERLKIQMVCLILASAYIYLSLIHI